MIVDGNEYDVSGRMSTEDSWDESESETEFSVKLSESRYMLVEQSSQTESERDENSAEYEFVYSIYDGGVLVERSTLSYESDTEDREGTETEIEMVAYKNGVTTVFLMDREQHNGRETIRIRAGEGRNIRTYYVRMVDDGNGGVDYVIEEVIGNYR